MAYTETRVRNDKKYYYRMLSVRKGDKISKKRKYLGVNLSREDLVQKEILADKSLFTNKKYKNNEVLEKIKSKAIKILKKNKVKRAGIFGSYARGDQKKNSDIDILVEIDDPNMSLLDFIGIMQELKEKLKRKVDLVEYKAIKPLIKNRILNEEIRII